VGSDFVGIRGAVRAGRYSRSTRLEVAIGGYCGKRIIDLGSGTGQFAAEFAYRGAEVTCIDVSATYLSMVRQRMNNMGVMAHLVTGYMDHVTRLTDGAFDAAFCHVSWYYCMNDLTFAKRIVAALRPGGVALIRANIDAFEVARSPIRSLSYWLNQHMFLKIGHPHPPRGRIAFAFRRLGATEISTNYDDPLVDVVLARKLPS